MMKNNFLFVILAVFSLNCLSVNAQNLSELKLKIDKPYLNLPVSGKVERAKMTFSLNGKPDREFVIRLSSEPEYWVFADMTAYKGKTLTITYAGDLGGLKKIFQADTIVGQNTIYHEKNRPQLHFTPRRGWMNDPNGLLYADGEYHLFFQHNPYEREWENMHWGHAVSHDLIHWTELPEAIYPDHNGTAFSGSAVMDYKNTSGFGNGKGAAPMVAIYTAASPDRQVQCLAYSLDKGRTWTKYAGNPVINSKEKWNSQDTRDPKVFWYAPAKHWVLVLNERDGHSIYNSTDLKNWEYQSHTNGFWECPELFELQVINSKRDMKLWVMYGASGSYMLGTFDGKTFTPVSGKKYNSFGAIYAAQTFTNIPASDGRRIQIGWDRIDNPEMPFKSQQSLPTELTLRRTTNGIQLFSNPVKEIDNLQKELLISQKNLSADKANEMLHSYSDSETLRIKATIKFSHATSAGLNLYGQQIIDYDMSFNKLNGNFYSLCDYSAMEMAADIIVDKTTVQVYFDGGGITYCLQREPRRNNREGFHFWGHNIEIKNIEVWSMQSVWK